MNCPMVVIHIGADLISAKSNIILDIKLLNKYPKELFMILLYQIKLIFIVVFIKLNDLTIFDKSLYRNIVL